MKTILLSLLLVLWILSPTATTAQNQPKPSFQWIGKVTEITKHLDRSGLIHIWYTSNKKFSHLTVPNDTRVKYRSVAESVNYYDSATRKTYGVKESGGRTTVRKNGSYFSEIWVRGTNGFHRSYENQSIHSPANPLCKGSWYEKKTNTEKIEIKERPKIYTEANSQQKGSVSWAFVFHFSKYNKKLEKIGTDFCIKDVTLLSPTDKGVLIPCGGGWLDGAKFICYDSVRIHEN